MLVYGDHAERCDAAQRAVQINRHVDSIARLPAGLARHSRLVGAFIETGRLLQGVADKEFAQTQSDRSTATANQLGEALLQLALCVRRSWDSGFKEIGDLPAIAGGASSAGEVEIKLPEGYAFYAVYPEAYIEAARRLNLMGTPRVIGIRSIGTSLGAIVAAALDAPAPITVRPFGDPYDRKIALDAALERELLSGDPHFVIVDEGPGQSGSSFGAVCDWLQERGVPLDRIALLPSHGGSPGAAATRGRVQQWQMLQREPADFSQPLPKLLEAWCADLIGALDGPLQDISGGAWRRLRYSGGEEWPAAVPAWERRKFLGRIGGRPVLLKYAGLGEVGEQKLALARALHSEGLTPQPLGLVHGFIAERWLEDAAGLAPDDEPIAEIARYLSARARLLPAPSGSGASIEELLAMAGRNLTLELGGDSVAALDHWRARLPELERRVVRVRTDNKLDRQEWFRARDGSLIKTDALDHHQAHDLVGCQPLEWDVAGAIAEFDLDQKGAAFLVRQLGDQGARIDSELLRFCHVAYLAFRIGRARLAEGVSDREDGVRLSRRAADYARRLRCLLQLSRAATRPESLVD